MDAIQKQLLEAVAGLHEIPVGAYNIRTNGKSEARNSTEHIEITPRESGDGINIRIKDGTRKESVHIPVVLSQAGLEETVYNDFYIGDNCDVTIIAGCGIHNGGDAASRHDGIHSFFIGKNSRVKYVEKHYGSGDGKGERIMNPETIVEVGPDSTMEMETVQIKGVDSTKRMTRVKLDERAHKAREICEKYPRQSKAIRMQLHNLAVYEKKGETDLDLVAGTFGHLLEELFIMEEDVWEEYLRRFGFYLGKFIYILDAYDDLEKDLEKGNYNPLKPMYESFGENQDAYEKEIYQILVMMMAEVGNAYEKLPCLQESEILRNIIYSGVWSKYNKIKKERQEKKEKNGK